MLALQALSDTGEKLDIVYTTDSLIVTTPTDGHTSVVIAKLEKEVPCIKPNSMAYEYLILAITFPAVRLLVTVSGCIVVMHLIFKELRTVVGKLLMIYNSALVCYTIITMSALVTQYNIAVSSYVVCYMFALAIMLVGVSIEATVTCILHKTVHAMYSSNKLRRVTPEQSNRHFKYYKIYILGAMLLTLFFIISYDAATGNYKAVIQPNGLCTYLNDHTDYNTTRIAIGINKTVQLVLFIA